MPVQIQEQVQHLLDIITHFDSIVLVNTDSFTTGNTFFIQVTILNKRII